MRPILLLLFLLLLQPYTNGMASNETYGECIQEPVFKGRVCTVQAHRDANIGVILIHGLSGSTDDWASIIPELSKKFHVVAFDLPGFGLSDKGSQDYSPTRYAHLVQYLADHYLRDKPYHVIGHSMGGAIALRYASRHPSGLQRLVLIDAAGILHPLAITKFQAGSLVESKSGIPQTRGFIERLSGKLLEQADRLPISAIDIANNTLGRDLVLQGGPEKIAALELAGENFSPAISATTFPTLILWGDNDLIAPLRTGKVLAAQMPQAQLTIIAGSGHEPMLDQTDRLNSLLTSYLNADDTALAEYFVRPPIPATFTSQRKGMCNSESGKIYEGDFQTIELHDCSNITIRNGRTGKLVAINSRISLHDMSITGKEVGIQAKNSDITITNGEISGTIAIDASESRFDIAGTRLSASQATVRGVNSKLLFSVSQVKSPITTGFMHTYKNMLNEEL